MNMSCFSFSVVAIATHNFFFLQEIEKSEQFQLSLTTLEVQNSKLQEELLKVGKGH